MEWNLLYLGMELILCLSIVYMQIIVLGFRSALV